MKLATQSADKKTADPGPQSGDGFVPACLRRGEVAGLLQVSVWTVDRMAAAGEIRKVKFGRAARFVRAEVEELLKQKLKR